jgi:hypothetical protein
MIESSLSRDDLVADSECRFWHVDDWGPRHVLAGRLRRRRGRLGVDPTRGGNELPAVRTSAYGGRCLDRGVVPH